MVVNAIVSLVAILALSFLGWCLLEHNINGTIAILIVAAISGIAGYNIKEILSTIRGKNKGGG